MIILVRRWWAARRLHEGITYWFIIFGAPSSVVLLAVILSSGLANGWWQTYELVVGIASPKTSAAPFLALTASILGWLFVPATIGALAGFFVERQITSYRDQTIQQTIDELERRIVEE
jgi:hypothetical protein